MTLVGAASADDLGLDRLEHFSSRHGLSQDWVLDIYQDSQGFIWLSTDDGLNRFDGFNFKVYRNAPEGPRSLSSNFVTNVYEDRHGNLWVGTGNGLNRLDRSRDDFSRFFHEERPDSLSNSFIYDLTEASGGALYVATGNGLNRFDREAGTFERLFYDPEALDGPNDSTVIRLHPGNDGGLWLGFADGILRRLEEDVQGVREYALHEEAATSGDVWAIAEDAQGHLWLGTDGGDLIRFDPVSESRSHHRLSASGITSINAVLPRPDGSLWIGTESNGVLVFGPDSGDFSAYRHDPADAGSPGSNRIMHFLEDQSGVIWLATEAGLDKLDPSRLRFAHYRHRSLSDASLSDDLVFSALEDSTGSLWVGTPSGLDRLDRERDSITRFRHDPEDPGSAPRQIVSAMLEDSAGGVWLGTHFGLSRYRRASDDFEHLEPKPDDPESLIEGWIYDVVEGRPGELWIGGIGGLNHFETREEHLRRFRHDPARAGGLGPGAIYDLYYDQQAGLWLGMADSGLALLKDADPSATEEEAAWLRFRHDPNDPQSLSSDTIGAIHRDRAGVLWVGTLGGGLNRLEIEAGTENDPATFRRYRESDGLANDNILAILEDNQGYLWLSSHRGLTRFDPRTGECKSYDADDGLQGNAFTFRSATRTEAGELMFGGPFGLNAFFPDQLEDDALPPRVAITDFRLFNRSVPFAERLSEADVEGEQLLTLSHRDQIFGFEFAALHFAKPTKNRYRYRLEGFSEDWVETDATHRHVQYTDLDAGNYRFRVQAANPDGVWNEDGASVTIKVLPPLWKTWWAYSLYTLGLALALAGYLRSHQRKIEQERSVNRRLQTVNRLKDEFLAKTSHELRTPLYGMTGLAESLIDGATGELPEATRANLEMIVASGRRLSHLVGDILDFSKLRHKSLELRRNPVDLKPLADVVLTLSRPLVGSKDLRLINSVPDDLPAADADENRLQQILYNLVGNAIKFTEVGTVEVSGSEVDGRLEVRVADTGIGIAEAAQERIFDAFEQADATIEREHGGTGLGLAVTRQLVELHGGTIEVESSPGEGSMFSFSLQVATEPVTVPSDGSSRPELALARSQDRPALAGDGSSPVAGDGPRVLVVDDEPVNLQVLRNYLAVEDFHLTLASSGEEALRLLEEQAFDLVLLDVMMPRLSGYEVCKVLRESHSLSDLPVIFLTARNQDTDVVTGMALGANDYLTKPISKDRLLARVRPHLDLLNVHRNLEDLVESKMSEIKVLQGILPICAKCKKIRDDENNWNHLEVYIDRHSEAQLSHGICPECVQQYLSESSHR